MSCSSFGDGVTVFDFIELLHASDWVSSPVYAGWLHKKSKNWIMNLSGYAWQPKWVALQGLELIYMDDEPTNNNKSSIHIKRMTIGSTTKIMSYDEEDEERKDSLCFSIQPDCTKPRIWQFRAESDEEKTNWLIKISQVHAIAAWLDSYTKERVLGVGAQGTVYEMVHKNTGQRLAVKEVNIESEKQMSMAITEAKLLMEVTKNVSHPCIMQIEKVFQVVDKFFLVFPLCTGGELYEAVVRRGHFTERKASRIVHDLVSALHALHQYNILHLDIKPENIIFESEAPNARIKLTDFGLSKVFANTPESWHTRPTQAELAARAEAFINCGNFNADHVRGTFGYMSPELILSGYCSTASDVFAAGVILYILLCGYPPFNSKSVRQLFVRTVKGAYKLSGPEWDSISAEAKDLVRRMLDVNMETRITTQEVLNHPWITKVVEADLQQQQQQEALSRSHAASMDEALLPLTLPTRTSQGVQLAEGLHGKSSVVYGSLLHTSNSVHSTTSTSTTNNTMSNTTLYTDMYDSPIMNSDVSLKIALNHLAGHVKELKTEKLAKTMNRLMLAKQTSGESKLAGIYLKPYRASRGGSSGGDSGGNGSNGSNGGSNFGSSTGTSGSVYHTASAKSTMAPILEERTIDSADDHALHVLHPTLHSADSEYNLISSTNTSGKDSFQFDAVDIEKIDIHSPISPISNVTSVVSVNDASGSMKVPITPSGNKDDELLQIINSEAREIVTSALFDYFGAVEGCLSVAQFVRLLMKLGLVGKSYNGSGEASVSNTTNPIIPPELGLYGVLIAQFTDNTNKGHITMDDFFTAQVLILQRNELYLRTIYKQYQHSVPYPGRQDNFDSAYKSLSSYYSTTTATNTAETIDSASTTTPSLTNTSSAAHALTLYAEPPRYITAKHVASVFERFGYDPRSGTKVFNILYDVLAKLKRERRVSSVGGVSGMDGVSRANTTHHTHTAHGNPVTHGSAADDDKSHTHSTTSLITESVLSAFSYFTSPTKSTHPTHTINTNTDADHAPISPTSPSSTSTPPLSPHLVPSIDLNEFLHLSQMDEVLVDVFSREAHMKLFTLFQRVEMQYLLCREKMGENVDTTVLKKVVSEEVKEVLDDPTF